MKTQPVIFAHISNHIHVIHVESRFKSSHRNFSSSRHHNTYVPQRSGGSRSHVGFDISSQDDFGFRASNQNDFGFNTSNQNDFGFNTSNQDNFGTTIEEIIVHWQPQGNTSNVNFEKIIRDAVGLRGDLTLISISTSGSMGYDYF